VAAALKNEPGLQVEEIDGNRGEFTVLVDGREVIRKSDSLPEVDQVVAAVRKAVPVAAAG
jgi:hypothetical protein